MYRTLCLIVCSVTLLAGCVRSLHPILKDDQVVEDESIVGTWVNEDAETIEVQPASESMVHDILFTEKDGDIGRFKVRIGKVGPLLIAEIAPAEPDASSTYKAHLAPLFSFMVIEQTSPKLVMSTLNPDWLRQYLEERPGELELTGTDKDEMFIISPTDKLQQFLLKHWNDPKSHSDPVTFVRPGDPSTRPAEQP